MYYLCEYHISNTENAILLGMYTAFFHLFIGWQTDTFISYHLRQIRWNFVHIAWVKAGRQIPHLTYMLNLEESNSWSKEWVVVAGGLLGGTNKMLIKEKFQLCKMNKFQRSNVQQYNSWRCWFAYLTAKWADF